MKGKSLTGIAKGHPDPGCLQPPPPIAVTVTALDYIPGMGLPLAHTPPAHLLAVVLAYL